MPRMRALAIACVLVTSLNGCASETESAGEGEGEGAPANLEHVHGLGINPADGALFAGTHHGLFRADESSVDGPVAGLEQDFMGFTVAGPNHFLASGHPGPGQDAPAALGVLESKDAGKTWEVRSLAGEADCHALTYSRGTAYCMNSMSGELLASSDLESWQPRSDEPLYDVAVSPDDAAALIATSAAGPVASDDGGRTFSLLEGAPPLVFVEWLYDGTVVGTTPEGTVFTRTRNGDDFATAGALPGQPEAFHAANAKEMYAAVGGRLYVSTDGGRSFESLGG